MERFDLVIYGILGFFTILGLLLFGYIFLHWDAVMLS